MRREVQNVFADEIGAAYEALELESFSTGVQLKLDDLQYGVCEFVKQVTGDEMGTDSLQATRLARHLNSAIQNLSPAALRLTPAFIYQNTSISRLAEALRSIIRGEFSL
ncbi:putative secondary metabolism biosynthetic enzyme [Diplodia intermedia]|uniref:Secondary metabolism biosynthetic enzyme n=1 Tax=Diplodia intermedia TaxID=856260 RepID=A0ABR3TC57_9PEZI